MFYLIVGLCAVQDGLQSTLWNFGVYVPQQTKKMAENIFSRYARLEDKQ